MSVTFEYGTTTVGDLSVQTAEDAKTGREKAKAVLVDGEPLEPTQRFWTSLYGRYGLGKAIFNYFSYEEVFRRVADRSPNERMRYCIERDERKGTGRLLAVTNPRRPLVKHDDLMELVDRYGGGNVVYHNGVVESHHAPRVGENRFNIAGDSFMNRFVVRTPVDGYGLPSIYLALLREVCSNGMIGLHRAFRSELSLGRGRDEVTFSLSRALDSFHNDEGYAALRQRFESAAGSWASVHEALKLYNLCAQLIGDRQIGSDGASLQDDDSPGHPALKAFHRMTGDVSRLYGLANLETLSAKRQRTLPVNCKVYDMLNFATELATHQAFPEGARRLQAWVGGLVSGEYDLEGTCDQFGDFRDFFAEGGESRQTLDDISRTG